MACSENEPPYCPKRHEQRQYASLRILENSEVRPNVAGTLRVPWLPRENAVISPRRLRHTECAYYFAVLLPENPAWKTASPRQKLLLPGRSVL